MFIIFGWGFTTTRVFGVVFPVLCPNCHNEEFWVLRRIRRWITLFFIPVIPYESTHALMCPVCGAGRELHGADHKRAKMYAEANTAFGNGALSDDEYSARLAAISSATDAQVSKGLGHVTAVSVPAAPLVDPTPAVPPPPKRPTAVAASAKAAFALRPDLALEFCGHCGREFEAVEDLYCPRCGAPRALSNEVVT